MANDYSMEKLKNIIESLLFVSDEPLSIDRVLQVLPDVAARDIRQAMSELGEEYENRQGGFHLREVAGGYQIRTRPEYREYVKRMVEPSPARLSKAALETLAIVAYKQPVIRSEIEQLRGVDCGGVLRLLMERKLVRVLGRKEIPGRPLIYATTREFLEVFELKDLKDLPTPKEIEELGREETQHSASVFGDPEWKDKIREKEAPPPEIPTDSPDQATAGQPVHEKEDESLNNE